MLSTLRHFNQDPDLHVYLIFDNVDAKDLSLAVSHLGKILPGFSFIQASSKPLEGFPVNGHATVATYFRLLLPELLPMSVNRVIFIDSDTVITDSLGSLWNLDLQGKSIAAVAEHRISCKDHGHEFGSYFNAGIMLADLQKWRQSSLLERGRTFANAHPDRMRHWDQDVLNHVFKNDWIAIPDRWNACPHLFGLTPEYKDYDYVFTDDEREAQSNPAIVHFAGPGPVKPWNSQCKHIYKDHYLAAKADTPWASTPLEDIPPHPWLLAINKAVFQAKCFVRRNFIVHDRKSSEI